MLRGILFDLDDTLYAYAPCNAVALRAVFEGPAAQLWSNFDDFQGAHDGVRGELARELAGQAASHNRILFFKRMLQQVRSAPNPKLTLEMFDVYWTCFLEHMQPAPEAHDVLGRLARARPLAIVSNHTTDIQLRKIARLGFETYFRAIVTSEEVGEEKPSAGPFRAALSALGIGPSEALMVGDDPHSDVRGAQGAGLRVVQTNEFRLRSHEPPTGSPAEHVIERLGEVEAIVAALE